MGTLLKLLKIKKIKQPLNVTHAPRCGSWNAYRKTTYFSAPEGLEGGAIVPDCTGTSTDRDGADVIPWGSAPDVTVRKAVRRIDRQKMSRARSRNCALLRAGC
jgi:hypothetical protein